jgi:hypothetical protein
MIKDNEVILILWCCIRAPGLYGTEGRTRITLHVAASTVLNILRVLAAQLPFTATTNTQAFCTNSRNVCTDCCNVSHVICLSQRGPRHGLAHQKLSPSFHHNEGIRAGTDHHSKRPLGECNSQVAYMLQLHGTGFLFSRATLIWWV